MDIPILLGANPKTANPGVLIPIRFEKWQVRVEGLIDSKLTLHSDLSGAITLNGGIYSGPCKVIMRFDERGTEKSISAFAVECK